MSGSSFRFTVVSALIAASSLGVLAYVVASRVGVSGDSSGSVSQLIKPPSVLDRQAASSKGEKEIDDAAVERMDMDWDSRLNGPICTDVPAVAGFFEALRVEGVAVTEAMRKELKSWLATFVTSAASDDPKAYFEMLARGGEIIQPARLATYQVSPSDASAPGSDPDSSPWEIVRSSFLQDKGRSGWRAVVPEGSFIRIHDADDFPKDPSVDLAKKRGAIRVFHPLTMSPEGFAKSLLAKDKSLMVADVNLFIRHADSANNVVRPYIIRLWWDPKTSVWRPLRMWCFENRYESISSRVLF